MMARQRSDLPLWGIAVLVLASGCARSSLDDTSSAAPAGSAVPDSGPAARGSASDAAELEDASGSMSGADGSRGDAGCSTDILTFHPSNTAFEACWSCALGVCASQLAACGADCQCNSTIASALACAEDGLSLEQCFQATFVPTGDPAESNAEACLLQHAYAACDCAAVVATDAAAASASDASMPAGGGSGFSNGECDSMTRAMAGNTEYQVSCSCPEAACVCFGPTTHVVKYSGCPSCPSDPGTGSSSIQEVFALCGFPPYQ
jgi:hypothetical protein